MRKRTGVEERRRLLAEHRKSGMTRKEFCERHGIPLTTLDSWNRAERKVGNPRLLAVKIQHKTERNEADERQGFTLSLGNGRRIASSWQFSEADLGRLIRVVESA
jgi:transposase-like protein